MKLWLFKNSEVPLREQLTTQILLGIVSGDLRAGERLPSIRELARRFNVHSNTISAAYNHLAESGWVEIRQGSGVFVRSQREKMGVGKSEENELLTELDQLIQDFFILARERGYSLAQIESRLNERLSTEKPDRIVVVEDDCELRQILFTEIQTAVDFPVIGATVSDCQNTNILRGAIGAAMNETAERLALFLPVNAAVIRLKLNSVQTELAGKERPAEDELIAVVSRWETFLRWSQTVLSATGIAPEQIVFRNANQAGWLKGLDACSFVITDSHTALDLPAKFDVRVFRIIAESSLEELRNAL